MPQLRSRENKRDTFERRNPIKNTVEEGIWENRKREEVSAGVREGRGGIAVGEPCGPAAE